MHWHKDEDRIVLSLKRWHLYGVAAAEVLLWLVALGLIVWTLGQAGEMQRLREENELYARQAEMTAQRLTEMESRLAELDALDAEIRSLMSGSAAGRGDGGVISAAPTAAVNSRALLTRLGEVADRMETRRISLSLVRAALRDSTEVAWAPPLRAGAVNPDVPTIAPVRGGELTDPFGWRSDPFTGEQRFHEGIDLAAAYGTPIVATANGIVTRAEWVDGYGHLVEIQHVGGVITRYGHNSLVTVRVGDRVEVGQVVAFMGSTGRSTGSHVHYEVRINGVAVDPMLFIRPQR